MMQIGVAHFNDPDEPQNSGILTYAGGSLREVEHWSELGSDTVWLSNVNRATLSAEKLSGLEHIKSAQFLTVSQDALTKELLLQVADEPELHHLRRLHEVYELIFNRLNSAFDGINLQKESRLIAELGNRVRLNVGDKVLSPMFLGIVNDCYSVSITVPGQKIKATNKVVNLSYPRAPYGYYILDQDIPIGAWTKIGRTSQEYGEAFTLQGDDLIKMLSEMSSERAAFVKVSLVNRRDNAQLDVMRLANPGGEWMTVEEAIHLGTFTDLKLLDAFISDGVVNVMELLSSYGFRPPEREELFSASVGFYLTEIWRALTSEQVMASDNSSYYTPSAVYLKAFDRIACMKAAQSVIERGFDVNAYGNNMLSVSVPEEHVSALLEMGYEKGLIAQVAEGDELVAEHRLIDEDKRQQEQEQEQQSKDDSYGPYIPPNQ